MCSQCCCSPKGMQFWAVLSALIAVGCFSVAIFVPPYIDSMLSDGIDDAIVVTADAQAENSKAYRTYTDPTDPDSTPIWYKTYLFHVKNAALVVTQGAKPDLEQKGPYVYRKYQYKRDVKFTKNVFAQDLVTYRTQTYYEFQPQLSEGNSESDMITNVNLAYVLTQSSSTGSLYAQHPDVARHFMTKNVTSWLFGFNDPILSYINSLNPYTLKSFPGLIGPNQATYDPAQKRDQQFVGTAPDQALIRTYTMYREQDYLKTQISGTTSVRDTWKTPRANRVAGTDGSQFPRNIQDGQTILVYVSQLSRVLVLGNENSEHVTFKELDLVKFTLPKIFLSNAIGYPNNGDYYMLGYNGIANLTAAGTTDFFVSKPHFLDADAELTGNVTGLSPNRDAHDTFLNIEPITGATMQACKRLQLNVRLTTQDVMIPFNNSYIPGRFGASLPNQPTGLYVPCYWAEESAELSDSQAKSFRESVYRARMVSMIIVIAGEAAACAFVVTAVILFCVSQNKALQAASPKVLPTGGGGGGAAAAAGGDGATKGDLEMQRTTVEPIVAGADK